MDVSHILAPLNDAQRQAVTAPLMPTLVLAGAGSGKTRVLTHRVEWLVQVEGVSPHGILAVTFTNKAAAEMRSRIETQLGLPSAPLWIGTFHGISHRLLRLHWREAGLPQGFHILDSEDQQRLVKKIIRGLNLDDTRWIPREVCWFINKQKDEGLRPQHLKDDGDATRRQMIKLYEAYETACRRNGVVDFAELLLRSCEILRDTPGLADHYRSRFGHVLVDEFQDTNTVQYQWMKVLTGSTGIPYVVGDDDQSIYRWRGARVENLQQYRKDYHGVQLFRLEQNYRSTGNILAAANAVISNNTGRIGKKLWTSDGAGTPIRLYRAYNERDEAEFVVNKIREWVARGGNRRDNAILYRSNAQSRVFEEYLLAARIPYRVYGGLRFFERQEIKDALAYLRLISNRDDDASFERVVNLPTRGIGARTIEVLRAHSRANSVSMWQSSSACGEDLGSKATSCLQAFLALIEKLDAETRGMALHEQVDHVIQASGLVGHYQKEKADKGEARLENLEELVSAASGFQPEDGDMSPLMAFPVPRRARVGRRPGRGMGRLRADDDAALRQGARVSGGFPVRHGGWSLPAPALGHGRARARGRAPALLCGRHARHEAAVLHLRRAAAHARYRQLWRTLPLPGRTAARTGRGSPTQGERVAPGLRAAIALTVTLLPVARVQPPRRQQPVDERPKVPGRRAPAH